MDSYKIHRTRMIGSLNDIDFSKIEKRMLGHMTKQGLHIDMSKLVNTNPCSEITLPAFIKEKPMNLNNLKVTRPVMVGHVNILTARDFELAAIIREAQELIEANKDLVKLSDHYLEMTKELEEVIALCVEQLDKDVKEQPKP